MRSLANLTRPEGDPKILASGPSAVPAADRLAKGLGWFSIGLGLTQLFVPHVLTRTLGLKGREGLMRVFGAREIASGVLTLSTERQTGMTSRVVGDMLDLAVLGVALGSDNRKRSNVGAALAMTAGLTLIDLAVRKALADTHGRRGRPRDYADRSGFPSKPHGSDDHKARDGKSEGTKSENDNLKSPGSDGTKSEGLKSEGAKSEHIKSEQPKSAGSISGVGSGGVKPSSGQPGTSQGHTSPTSAPASPSDQGASKPSGATTDSGPSGGPVSFQEPPASNSQ
ncbi:DUF4267 domain-containing protein [Kaistia geumhonensis]|uniref:RDD family protein n=1 Tax=Kaistia geumhonensis TaxID=410839 RepID=A0ABU0M190_9HYPH|nr:DUF4267 domain-containing protein [Kaistia geumhonensis]MCX5480151.1 DUF4267 domain-containing protein [Kaistia geumhonensis]MDQ0514620.1 hypothetical protein [Kaistia geumhonensis]